MTITTTPAAPPLAGHLIRAKNVLAGDVVRIGPHQLHGEPARCDTRTVEITAVTLAAMVAALDWRPYAEFWSPGCTGSHVSGCAVYDALAEVELLWHGQMAGAL